MSDDAGTQVAEQNLEPETDEALAAFLEDDEGTEDLKPEERTADEQAGDEKSEKKAEKETDKKPEKKEPEAKSEKKESESEEDEAEDDKEKITYSKDIDARLKSLDEKESEKKPDESEKTEKEPEGEATESKDKKEKPEKKDEPKEIDLSKIDFSLTDDDFDKELKEYKDDYPEDFNASLKISSIMTKKAINELVKSGVLEKPKFEFDDSKFATKEDMSELGNIVKDIAFWGEVSKKHPDHHEINSSKEFVEWINEEKNEPIRKLTQPLLSVEDAIMVLDYYKMHVAEKKAKKHDKKSGDEKRNHDDLHTQSMRNKGKSPTVDGPDPNDAKAAFDEDD